MTDEYLWDRSGPEDPDIARLEQVLGTLRAPDPPRPLALPAQPSAVPSARPPAVRPADPGVFDLAAARAGREAERTARTPTRRFVLPFAVAATLAIAAVNVWLYFHPPAPRGAFEIARLEGSPRVSSTPLAGPTGQLPVGEWLETDATARARIRVARIGHVDVEPHTRVGLLSTRPGQYRLRLDRGTLQALILAPPGQFTVETPAAVAVDLGCAYRLQVRDDGETELWVTSGWVTLHGDVAGADDRPRGMPRQGDRDWQRLARASFVRSGAMCLARPGFGPGTPFATGTSAALKDALRVLDFADATPDARAAAVDRVLAEARASDAITLWHLIPRVDPSDRERLFDRLAAFAPPPDDVTREGIRAGNAAMLERWWIGAKLGPPTRWR